MAGSKKDAVAVDFAEVFSALKACLKPHEKNLTVVKDGTNGYALNAGYSEKFKRDIFFAGIEIKKNYVSLYLFPVYMYPKMLKTISPELKKRMQGKSCFNFRAIDKKLLTELSALTRSGIKIFKEDGYIKGK